MNALHIELRIEAHEEEAVREKGTLQEVRRGLNIVAAALGMEEVEEKSFDGGGHRTVVFRSGTGET